METTLVWRVAYLLRQHAEHHAPQDYGYSRDLGGVSSIGHRDDWTGRNHPLRRLWRAGERGLEALRGADSLDRAIFGEVAEGGLRRRLLGVASPRSSGKRQEALSAVGSMATHRLRHARAASLRALKPYKNLPDGSLGEGSVLTFWEEDGEYFQLVQPTVGSRLSDFLEADPQHPLAQSLAEEVKRLLNSYGERLGGGGNPLLIAEPDEEAPLSQKLLEFTTPGGEAGHAYVTVYDSAELTGAYAYITLTTREGRVRHWLFARQQGLGPEALEEDLLEGVLNVVAGAVEETHYRLGERA